MQRYTFFVKCKMRIVHYNKKMYFCIQVMKHRIFTILLAFMFLTPLRGQEADTSSFRDNVASPSTGSSNIFTSTWKWFSRWRDRAQLKGYEPGYVDYPKGRPWVVGLYGKMAVTNIMMHLPDMTDDTYFDIYNTTGLSSKLTAGIYYTGWGVSFGPRLSNKSDLYFSFSSYGRVFGFDIKLDNFRSMHSRMEWASLEGDIHGTQKLKGLKGPEMILLEINTYYVFNARKFSYASALSQTTWQRRSAGSMIAGLSYYASYTGFDAEFFEQLNIPVPYYADTLHLLNHNIIAGVGYAYNKVWDDGKWMLHASLLPMLRWSYYNNVDINPKGNLDDWPEEYRTLYQQKVDYLKSNAAHRRLSFAGTLRLAGFWNISPRWVTGTTLTVSNLFGGINDGTKFTLSDAFMLIYGAYRF